MIVGSGNIAKCLTDREGAIFFASGVSNSRILCQGEGFKAMRREMNSIKDAIEIAQDKKLCLFYFSSIGINFSITDYFLHKSEMEDIIRGFCPKYVILRIGNLIGDTNPNTFINYLRAHPEAEIKDEYRYMIDGATLNMLCQTLPLDQKIELSVATKIAKVKDLL